MDAGRAAGLAGFEGIPAYVDVDAYLRRIGYQGPLAPSAELLRSLHRAHMFSVPFENLDISLGREIICDEDRFLHRSSTTGAVASVTN